MRAILSNVE